MEIGEYRWHIEAKKRKKIHAKINAKLRKLAFIG